MSPARRRERLRHDMDDGQVELALGPMYEIELQPAGNARRERADDESIVAGVGLQLVGDRLERVLVADRGVHHTGAHVVLEEGLRRFRALLRYVDGFALPGARDPGRLRHEDGEVRAWVLRDQGAHLSLKIRAQSGLMRDDEIL